MHGLVLADDTPVQQVLEVNELGHLALHQLGHRHASPLGDHLGDVLGVHLLLEHPVALLQLVEVRRCILDATLQLWDAPVTDLRGNVEVALALHLRTQLLELLLERTDGRDRVLLPLPVLAHRGGLLLQCVELLEQGVQTLRRGRVLLLLQCEVLDLQLQNASLDNVDLGGERVDLDTQPGTGLVDEVDCLVRQEPTGDVPVGQHSSRHERRVLDAHTVVHLVTLLQTAQDGDGVLHRRFAHVHLLEPALKRSVFLDVLAVLVECRGTDHVQFAACEERLDHVAGVHCALGAAGADDGVNLVDEGDHLARCVGDLLEDSLEPLLELAAVLRPGNHRPEVERDEALVLQALGHIAVRDATCETLDDGGLANARFADEHRVVLGATREHLNRATDLVVAADDRIDLAVASALGEVGSVLLECLELLLGVRGGNPVRAAHFAQRLQNFLRSDAQTRVHREHEVLGGEVVVLQVLLISLGHLDDVAQFTAEARLTAAVSAGQFGDSLVGRVAHHERGEAELLHERTDDRVVLGHERAQEMVRGEFGVVQALGLIDRRRERLVGLRGPFLGVECHIFTPSLQET